MSETLSNSATEETPRTRLVDFLDEFGIGHDEQDSTDKLLSKASRYFSLRGINHIFIETVFALVASGHGSHATVDIFREKIASRTYRLVTDQQQASEATQNTDKKADWSESAACIGRNPEVFFPEPEMIKSRVTAMAQAAIAICTECPVREECLRYALKKDVRHGIWGGYTSKQRTVLRKGRAQRTTDIL